MTCANGAPRRSRERCSALFTLLFVLCMVACCCLNVSAQSHSQRSVNQATSETQYRPRESHGKPHDDDEDNDEGDEDDDWDFMSDAAILSLAAKQRGAAVTVTCAQNLQPAYLNDDYCDCDDGSDEPLTSACSHIVQQDPLTFQCLTGGQKFVSAFVGDGVCDCCDGSDEASGNCSNTCADRHDQILRTLQQRMEAVHTGLQIRDSYLTQYGAKLEKLHISLEETLSIASAVQRAFKFKQQTLQDAGTQPSPQEMHQLESMYYQLQGWQYQIFVLRKLLETTTFEDKEWKTPFAALVGRCFDYVVNEKELKGGTVNVIPREYVFSFCPFQNITQSEPSYPEWTIAERKAKKGSDARSEDRQEIPEAPQPILLGVWDQWTPAANSKADELSHRIQHYDFGHKCANDQHRVVKVDVSCAAENRVVSIEENEMCIYSLVFTSPAACDERDGVLLDREIERVQRVFESSKESKVDAKVSSHEEL